MKRKFIRRGQQHGNQTCRTNAVKRHWTTDSREGKRRSFKLKKVVEPLKIKPVEFLGHTLRVPG